MSRLLKVFLITLILGVSIYYFTTFIFKEKEENSKEMVEESFLFDISYGKEIKLEEMFDATASDEEVIIFIGNKEDDVTKKVSNILGKIENISTLNVYYLEKEEMMQNDTLYQNLFTTYTGLSNYMNFTPVILVFRENILLGGLPGEVEEKNIINFLEYTEVL